jgi:exopolysaccharide production protein ExoQ
MPPIVATLICMIGIAGLFYLDRRNGPRVSKALWIPALWLFIISSRPVSMWFGMTPNFSMDADPTNVYVEGSPVDRAVCMFLMLAALAVLFRRADRVRPFLRKNAVLISYLFFCLVSILWSDFPFVAFKRWTKTAFGDIPMVLIILTDSYPMIALKRVLTRVGLLFFPLSVLLTKYYTQIGCRLTNSWTMEPVGLATQKNGLGLDCLIWGTFVLWMFWTVYREQHDSSRRRRLLVYGTIIAMIIALLRLCNSTTSIVGVVCTCAVVFIAMRPARRATWVHILVLVVLGMATIALFFDPSGSLVEALGKSSTFSGRTLTWGLVLGMHTNPWVGTGFESFWLGPRLVAMRAAWPNLLINEAHNGYIEVYINLGWIGACFIVAMIVIAYKRVISRWRTDPRRAALFLGFLLCTLFNAFSENAFRMMTPSWVFFLLVILATAQPELFGNAPLTGQSQVADIAIDEPAHATQDTTLVPYWVTE